MQQHTHLTGLGRGSAPPLALVPQWTRTTTANAGPKDYPQAPIGFSAALMCYQCLLRRAAQRAVGLERKVSPREATLFPGLAHCYRSISLRGGAKPTNVGEAGRATANSVVRTGSGLRW